MMSEGGSPGKMIENSDRGITLNKPLAWTMAVAIVSCVWFGGVTIQRLQSTAEHLASAVSELQGDIASERAQAEIRDNGRRAQAEMLEQRIRTLETSSARQGVQFDTLKASIDEMKLQLRELTELLRDLKETRP